MNLNDLVQEVCSFVEFETRQARGRDRARAGREPIPVRVDLVQIEQVLLNLMSNALDALQEMPRSDRPWS